MRIYLACGVTDMRKGLSSLGQLAQLHDIEREIAGKPSDVRCVVHQEHGKSKLEALRAWAEQQLTRIPVNGDLPSAIRYGLGRWQAFSLFT